MEELKIERTDHTPEVHFEAGGKLSMLGRSFPEDIAAFFDPIAQWMEEYVQGSPEETNFELFFEYYNSSTARRITEMIFELENLHQDGKKVTVTWYYKAGDIIMKENGEEIKSVVDLPFEIAERVPA